MSESIKKDLGILVFGRMHLSQERVRLLIPYLQYFVEHGYLPHENLDEDIAHEGGEAPTGSVVAVLKEKPSEEDV